MNNNNNSISGSIALWDSKSRQGSTTFAYSTGSRRDLDGDNDMNSDDLYVDEESGSSKWLVETNKSHD